MRRTRLIFCLFFAVYTLVGSVLITFYLDLDSVFRLCCWMGPLIRSLTVNHQYAQCSLDPIHPDQLFCLHAARMPVIPLLMASLAAITNHLWFAALVKNVLVTTPLALVGWQYYTGLRHLPRWIVVGGGLFALTFPGVVIFHFYLGAEECVLIGLLAFVWGYLPLARRDPLDRRSLILAAVLNGLMCLTKSGMFPLAILNAAAYALLTRRRAVAVGFAGVIGAAMMSWGLYTLVATDHLTLGTSLDGYNLSKGNNEWTLGVYRQGEELDNLSNWLWQLPASEDRSLSGEWDYNAFFTRRALTFAREHPREELRLLALRFTRFYLIAAPGQGQLPDLVRSGVRVIYLPYVLIFRLLLWAGLMTGLIQVLRHGPRAIGRGDAAVLIPATYLVGVLIYSLPYLAGFAYWRHVTPIVIPTVLWALWALDQHAARPHS